MNDRKLFIEEFTSVTVDYSASLEKMIQKGRYDIVNRKILSDPEEIKAVFPVEEHVEVQLGLGFILSPMRREKIPKAIARLEFRSANIFEVLEYGALFQESNFLKVVITLNERCLKYDPAVGDQPVTIGLCSFQRKRFIQPFWIPEVILPDESIALLVVKQSIKVSKLP